MNYCGISNDNWHKIERVFNAYKEIEAVIVYGSRAKGNFKPGSDIDMTLIGDNLNLHLLNRVSLDLDDLLLPYIFDLSIYHHIENRELIEHIERVGKSVYKKNELDAVEG